MRLPFSPSLTQGLRPPPHMCLHLPLYLHLHLCLCLRRRLCPCPPPMLIRLVRTTLWSCLAATSRLTKSRTACVDVRRSRSPCVACSAR